MEVESGISWVHSFPSGDIWQVFAHKFCSDWQLRVGIDNLFLSHQVMSASALAGTEMALISAGVKIEPGSGVGAAIKYWADSSSVIKTRTPPT